MENLAGGEHAWKCEARKRPLKRTEVENPSVKSPALKRWVVYSKVVEVAGFEPASEDSAT